ncbi:MAG: glutamate--tRNA ligase family protein [Gemmatimonadota bacterium]|nr:glutamate--tRNA ligase family protein [Gemmatimonadota bacterium]
MRLEPGFVTRFAPAPTGYLHLGHVVNAAWVWGAARAFGGRVLLRVEDHDRRRCREEYETALLDDLDWLGLVPDGASTDEFRNGALPQRQSDAGPRYAARLAELERAGLVYACRCSRSDIARAAVRVAGADHPAASDQGVEDESDIQAPDGRELRYPGTCRDLKLDPTSTPARRVRIGADGAERFDDLKLGPQAQDPDRQCGDLLVRDRHGQWTYQFAVVVDDLEQGVDVVIRGEDLLASTGRQIRLARLLGRAQMPRFLHHPLVHLPDGRKLSKSAGDSGLRELRAAGRSASQVLGLAAQLGGLQPDATPIDADRLATLFG